jgi:hypothetical protein
MTVFKIAICCGLILTGTIYGRVVDDVAALFTGRLVCARHGKGPRLAVAKLNAAIR